MTADPITRLNAALEGRYAIERELGEGGMADLNTSSGVTVACGCSSAVRTGGFNSRCPTDVSVCPDVA